MIPLLLLNLSGSIVQSNQTHLIVNTASDSPYSQWISFALGFVSAIVTALIVKYAELKWREPKIKIKDSVVVRDLYLNENLQDAEGFNIEGQRLFHANRILVKNEGKTAAQNCKAYLHISETHYERTGWMLPDKNAGYMIILNVDDNEFLDLCAINNIGNRIITNEHGFTIGRVDSCMSVGNQNIDATIRITSSNAKECRRKIRIHNVSNHFPHEPFRIVEFLDHDE